MRKIVGMLVTTLVAMMLVAAPAAAQTKVDPGWGCTVFNRTTSGLLYEGGFFGTRNWANMLFAGCAQQNGGLDFDVIAFNPFKGNAGSEFDLEGGYTFLYGPWFIRIGGAYWNVQIADVGPRASIYDARVKLGYNFELSDIKMTAWGQLDRQELRYGAVQDYDVNGALGLNMTLPVLDWAKFLGELAWYHHFKSFGKSHDVLAFTGELAFRGPQVGGFKTTVGPWGRVTMGNILGTPGNSEVNYVIGLKAAGFN